MKPMAAKYQAFNHPGDRAWKEGRDPDVCNIQRIVDERETDEGTRYLLKSEGYKVTPERDWYLEEEIPKGVMKQWKLLLG